MIQYEQSLERLARLLNFAVATFANYGRRRRRRRRRRRHHHHHHYSAGLIPRTT